MTYCLGIKLDAGLVFASDSRISAGIDYISTYRKLHAFQPANDRIFVILTSGNLGTTQELLDYLRRDLDGGPERMSLRSVGYMFEAARYVGSRCLASSRPMMRRFAAAASVAVPH